MEKDLVRLYKKAAKTQTYDCVKAFWDEVILQLNSSGTFYVDKLSLSDISYINYVFDNLLDIMQLEGEIHENYVLALDILSRMWFQIYDTKDILFDVRWLLLDLIKINIGAVYVYKLKYERKTK